MVKQPTRVYRFRRELNGNLRKGLLAAGIFYESNVKRRYKRGNPLHVRTARLSDSPTHSPVRCTAAGKLYIEVGTNVVYARIHELGGEIRAKRKPYLAFKTYDGRWHKVKSVNMPARPVWHPVLMECRSGIVSRIRQYSQRPLRRR